MSVTCCNTPGCDMPCAAVKAWAIEGPDGEYVAISLVSQLDAWLAFKWGQHQSIESLSSVGYRAVQVEVRKINAAWQESEGKASTGLPEAGQTERADAALNDAPPAPAPAAPDALANTFAHWYDKTFPVRHEDTRHFNDCEEAFMAGATLRQQRGEDAKQDGIPYIMTIKRDHGETVHKGVLPDCGTAKERTK